MYVRKVHGRPSACEGVNFRASSSAGEVNTVMSRSSTTAFAMMRRPTHGVMRLEGDRFIEPRLWTLRPWPTLPGLRLPAEPGAAADPLAQVGELDTHRTGRLGKQAGGCHARQGIHL